jgi:hypothetical protein
MLQQQVIYLDISNVLAGAPAVFTTIGISSMSLVASAQSLVYPNISLIYQADGIQTVSMVLTATFSAGLLLIAVCNQPIFICYKNWIKYLLI